MLSNREGDRVPEVTFRIPTKVGWQELATATLFAHKTVVVFAVPGAFTCPYSPIQLLEYNEYAATLRAHGVDDIFCISVNDPFSLAAWAQEEGADQVRFIPDVRGDFTRAMGMMVNLADKGIGWRSRRYSMLVNDGVITKIFVEPEAEALDAMPVVANAETMLHYINPAAEQPEQMSVLMQMWRSLLSA
jgi:peroxiredoxin